MQAEPRNYSVEYRHPHAKIGIYYLARLEAKSDFTPDKSQALPMTKANALKAVIRAVNPAQVVRIS